MTRHTRIGIAVCLWGLLWSVAFTTPTGILSVVDFGAKGDGVTDDTQAFQDALNASAKAGGGIVFAPSATFMIKSHLTIPQFVTLEGVWQIPQAYIKHNGTTLLAVEGAGNPQGTPFITLKENSTVKGISVFYPEQTETNPPIAYPWTIASGHADNCSIVDVYLANPYQAVDFGTYWSGRHYIRNLYGQPLYRGIFVDQCLDVGRIENVHFYPFWTWDENSPIWTFMKEQGVAFTFGRTDWEYVSNCFAIMYNTGFHFGRFKMGPGNVLLTQSGADICQTAIRIDDCQNHAGVSFSNSQIYGDVIIGPDNAGPLKFTGCAFFGSINGKQGVGQALIDGWGQVSFVNCNFISIDPKNKATAAIRAKGGSLSLVGCDFMDPERDQVVLEPGVLSAIITGNRFRGLTRIQNRSDAKVLIENNIDDSRQEEPGAIVVDNSLPESGYTALGTMSKRVMGGDYLGGCDTATTGTGEVVASWSPTVEAEGRYEVFAWYGPDTERNREGEVTYAVRHAGGRQEHRLDQTKSVARWNSLGAYLFKTGKAQGVDLLSAETGRVCADAVKFVPTN